MEPVSTDARRIDLNCDLGEGFGHWQLGDDETLLGIVTSANVACGYHAGDAPTMRRVCDRAVAAGVVIGAQVGYRDLAGFGRQFIDVPPQRLRDEIVHQIGALDTFARLAGDRVRYVKPHGALYNAIVHHRAQAQAVVEAVVSYGGALPVLGLPGSLFLQVAGAAGLPAVVEAFADRGYTSDGWLVPRDEPGAVLTDPGDITDRSVQMAIRGEVTAVTGEPVRLDPASICVHGDTRGAAAIARAVRAALGRAGVQVQSFAGPR